LEEEGPDALEVAAQADEEGEATARSQGLRPNLFSLSIFVSSSQPVQSAIDWSTGMPPTTDIINH
jgi:hypothetical protein